MGVTTYLGRTRRCLMHKQNSTYWAAIGRTSAWTNESSPPEPLPSASDIDEAIVFVKPTIVSLAAPVSSNGDVTIRGQQYLLVDDADAVDLLARFLYVKLVLNPADGIPTANFRQIGIFTDLVAAVGHDLDLWLDPAHVTDVGTLEYLQNTTERSFGPDEERIVQLVIEFR